MTTSPPSTEMGSAPLEWFRKNFRPHFDDWVFGPIDRLVHSRDALIGFIFMTCAIDYLAGFWWGKSARGKVREAYKGFIDEYFPTGQYDADGIYESLRSGLVHMFTIQNKKYALTHNNPEHHLKVGPENQILLNAGNFRDDLHTAKERYFDDVEKRPDLLDRFLKRYQRDGFLKVEQF